MRFTVELFSLCGEYTGTGDQEMQLQVQNQQQEFSLNARQPAVYSVSRGAALASDDESEAALIERIRRQEQPAFEILYHRYYQRLARFIYRTTGCSESLEELINDTMYVVWCKAETFNGSAKPSTWIFGIAYNKALKSLKDRYRQQPEYDSELMETLENQFTTDLPSATDKLESAEWFARAFAQLPPEQRATIELTYYQDMSYQEIAELMQCSENTVKTRMFHARKKLQTILPQLAGVEPQTARINEGSDYEND